MTTYRYDIGFTFLDRDEALVRRLVEKLGPEVSTFFAPERQREIVGTDGVLTFSAVYRKESRTVAIVYGEDWGSTRWTAVEQQAIRERAFEAHSYDFATMIPIGTPIPRIPDWFPSTRVYADFSRLGEEGVVACLKERVVRFGGTAPDETAVDMATRLNREQQRAREVRSFLNSQAGVRAADSSVAEIFDTLERLAPECQAKFERNDQAHITAISRDYITVSLVWERYSNAVEGKSLTVQTWDGPTAVKGTISAAIHGSTVTAIETTHFFFDRPAPEDVGWRETRRDGQIFSARSLGDWCLKRLLASVERKSRSHG